MIDRSGSIGGQQKDGYLWKAIWDNIWRRGAQTMAISKVKGHATYAVVISGDVSHTDKQGNGTADLAASAGVRKHVPGLEPYIAWPDDRKKRLCATHRPSKAKTTRILE